MAVLYAWNSILSSDVHFLYAYFLTNCLDFVIYYSLCNTTIIYMYIVTISMVLLLFYLFLVFSYSVWNDIQIVHRARRSYGLKLQLNKILCTSTLASCVAEEEPRGRTCSLIMIMVQYPKSHFSTLGSNIQENVFKKKKKKCIINGHCCKALFKLDLSSYFRVLDLWRQISRY